MRPPLEWSVAARPLAGQATSGDRAVVICARGCALAAAVDGIGHGDAAAAAAEAAVRVLERFDGESVVTLVERCHSALRTTRGAAMSVASFDTSRDAVTWTGVGNVEGRLLRGGEVARSVAQHLLLHSGLVGRELPRLVARTIAVRRGDVLVLATDGIGRAFADAVPPVGSASLIAERILEGCALDGDDALALVARYLGEQA